MAESEYRPADIAAPSATGNAGPQFEGKVGAFYALSLLSGGEPRGLPGAIVRSVEFQQRVAGHPLDDVVIKAINRDGSPATLEIQVKRTLTFTASDTEFREVVGQIWEAAQRPDFMTSRYELAAAIARTTTRIEQAYQEVLHWARQVPDGATFAALIGRARFASDGMRSFVDVFRANLALAGAPTDDETVWQLLRRFQILVFDFESVGSDYEHRARERARWILAPDQADRANDLWPVLIDHVGACARAAGAKKRPEIVTFLGQQHGYRFTEHPDVRPVYERLAEAADRALDDINDKVGGARLARKELIDEANAGLEQHRVLHITGSPGVGKSWVMKHLARQLQSEGRILVVRNGRIIPGGWLPMANAIGWTGSQADLFNELGCGGGATLFIDNIDQIDDPADWATVRDLLSEAMRSPGWRVVTTSGLGSDEWKMNLPATARAAGVTSLSVGPISDEEKAELYEQNRALAVILAADHPAKGIAENLFYLSRMIDLGVTQDAGIATELDLARLWWRYGAGRSEDDRRFARLKLLRIIGSQVLSHPSRVAFKADDLDPATVAELLRFDSMREETKGSTVTFRHDVLRDWTIGFQLYEDASLLGALPTSQPLPVTLGRALEIAARLALADDPTGQRWLALLAIIERDGTHGSWKRPILLALPRSENAIALFVTLSPVLFESGGQRLREIMRLMLAVESEPLVTFIARTQPEIAVPAGANDLVVPKGAGWKWLVLWLVTQAGSLPSEVIPDVVKVFQAWLMTTQNYRNQLNTEIVGILFDWLALIENHTAPRTYRSREEAPPDLNIAHVGEVRDEIRMTAFTFANHNSAAAARYLSGIGPDSIRYYDRQTILKSPGTLPQAAPGPFADFVLQTLTKREDQDRTYSQRRHGPFEIHEHVFLDASQDGEPFLSVLNSSPDDGLRLVRGLVEHATDWWREQYRDARRLFPRLSIPFAGNEKSFNGDQAIYRWARDGGPSLIAMTALRALEAWGHQQLEQGRPFEEVLHDVLGPTESSVAFAAVAVDVALSHWPQAASIAWPLVATPELLQFDEGRYTHDISGVSQLMRDGRQRARGNERVNLDTRRSRQTRLSEKIGQYVFGKDSATIVSVRNALENARQCIRNGAKNENEDPINGLRATVERAVRMTSAENWEAVKLRHIDGSEIEAHQFKPAPEEERLRAELAANANANLHRLNIRHRIQSALLEPEKSTPEFLREALEWAKAQPPVAEDEDNHEVEWNRRAVVMTAALTARDYEGDDRENMLNWARPILHVASAQADKEYFGNSQVEYNTKAIAALGLVSLYVQERDAATRDIILGLAGYEHPAVLEALGRHLFNLGKLDARLPRAITRIAIASAIHPHRADSIEEQKAVDRAHREALDAAIAAETHWLDGEITEPAWPELPPWKSRPRRRLRLGDWASEDDDDEDETPSYYVDEHALGALFHHLISFVIADVPDWIKDLVKHLMAWTDEANGPNGEDGRERDNLPYTWNTQFFDFVGILSVALPHAEVVDLFLNRILKLKDEPFHDISASFLRGYDRATIAPDTKEPENPADLRALLARRIKQGWNYRRLGREKEFTSESHAGDALTAMFYQPHRFASNSRPTIPADWLGLRATLATLTDLAVGAPTSGYLATLFLNLVESSHDPAFIPFVVQAAAAWCNAYGIDRNFWAEKNVGSRICAWLDAVLAKDASSRDTLASMAEELFKCLDILVQSGVAQARILEDKITNPERDRKAG